MSTKQLSWPWSTATSGSHPEDSWLILDVEAQQQLREVPPAYLGTDLKACDSDSRDQLRRWDHLLRTKLSSASIVSSYATVCDVNDVDMDDSSLSSLTKRPKQPSSSCYQSIRWRLCTPYRKLFSIVFFANIVAMICVLKRICTDEQPHKHQTRRGLTGILTAVSINLTASIAIRNEHVINMLFRIFVTHITPDVSLSIRRVFAKVYHFGGVHSGCGVAAVVWYGMYTAISMYDFVDSVRSVPQKMNISFTIATWLLMCALLTAALPRVRARLHDWFERSHRFLGWVILALFWAQTLTFCIFASRPNIWDSLLQLPTFWALIVMSGFVVYPWLRVRRVKVRCELLSEHAIRMHIDQTNGAIMQPCRVIAISHSPLKETHKFATIPNSNGASGYSMVISRAGDWTAKIIDNPPNEIWIKGAPAWGVLRVATMFDPVVIVATGSGIGPCLGLFNGCPGLNCRVIWQARAPIKTYGNDIVNAVLRADKNALIVDTAKDGRKDMTRLALGVYRQSNGEAVIVISNTEGTYQVVRELEARGVPAYGPIWDS